MAAGTILAALLISAFQLHAGVASYTFTLQKGNLQTNGVAYGSGTSYSGVVDGQLNDNSATTVLTSAATSTLGNAYQSGSPNGRQYVGLFSYDLTELKDFITANTGPYSSAAIQSVSFQLISAGSVSGTASPIRLYGTDPFTSSATWSNYTTATPWTVPYQNIGSSAQYGYTGGGSALTANLGGSSPNTGITSGNPLIWTSSAAFITAVQNALARSDKKLYLTANVAITAWAGGSDQRLSVNFSPATTVANRPQLTITVQVTTTSPPATWTGASGTSWATANNWSPSGVPGTDAPIIFDSPSTANLSTVLNQDFTIASLSVTNPSGPVSVSGANSLTIDTGGIDLSAATQDLTLSAPVVLGVDQAWNVAASRTLSVNGGISGSGALTVSGGGKVSLGAAASHTGNTTVSAGGMLQMGAANLLPNGAGVGNMSVSGALELNGYSESINGLSGNGVVDNTGAGAVTLTLGNASATFSGTIQNTGGALTLVKTGSGGETLSGANTYSGGTILNAGTLTPGNGNAIGTGTFTVNGGTFYPTASMTFTNPVSLNGGTLRIGGANNKLVTYAGQVTVTANSTLSCDGSTAGNTLTGSLDMGSGGYTLTATGSGTANTLSGPVSGTSGTVQVTAGTLALKATNTFGGTLRSVTGTLSIANVYAAQNATIDYDGADTGTIAYNNLNCVVGALTGSGSFSFGPTLSIGNNNSSTNYDGGMSGSGSIIKIGTGTWTLTGVNTYTGNTTISNGTLALSGSGSLASPTITVAGGATLDVSALTSPPFYLGYGQTLANSGAGTATLNGSVDASYGKVSLAYTSGTPSFQVNSGTLMLSSSTTFTINNAGSILNPGTYTLIRANGGRVAGSPLPVVAVLGNGAAGAPSLSLDGSGNLILAVANNGWTGAAGTSWLTPGNWASAAVPNPGDPINFNSSSTANLATVMNADFSISTLTLATPTGPVSIAPGGAYTLFINNGINLASATQDLTLTAPVALGADQTWSVTNTHTLSVSGGVSGGAALTVSGGGKVSLGGVATYTGDTTVAAGGTLQMGAASVLPNGAGFGNMNVNGTLDLHGNSQTINGLSGKGMVDNTGAGAATLTLANASTNFSGTVQNTGGALALVKSGTGSETLTGTNTHSGGTTINSGSIYPGNANAIGTGTLTVNGGNFYVTAASMTFTNPVTLNGGTLQVGGGNGHLATYTGQVTVTANSTLYCDGGTAGDKLAGGLDMGSGGHTLVFDGAGTNHNASCPIGGTSGTIKVNNGTLTLSGTNTFAGTLRSAGGTLSIANVYAAQNATIDYDGADMGTISYNGLPVILGALTGTGSFNLGANPLIGNNNLSTNYDGAISGSGSVTKIGTGTWTLTGANTYTGSTTISNGTLALSGSGGIASTNIIVAGGATFDVSAVSFTLGASQSLSNSSAGAVLSGAVDASASALSLTYNGASPCFIKTNGSITLSSGTVIQVNNTGAPLGNGHYTILAAATAGSPGSVTGPLPPVTVTGNGTPGTAVLQINGTGGLDLVVSGATLPHPTITQSTWSGGQLILQGTNGAPSGTYSILTSTNVAAPLSSWVTNATGIFTADGTFSNGIPVSAEPKRFFLIKQP